MPGAKANWNKDCRRCGRPASCCMHEKEREEKAFELMKLLVQKYGMDSRLYIGFAVETTDEFLAKVDEP